jgi:hypothetical protein
MYRGSGSGGGDDAAAAGTPARKHTHLGARRSRMSLRRTLARDESAAVATSTADADRSGGLAAGGRRRRLSGGEGES